MPDVVFIDTSNEEHHVDVPVGKSLMQAALDSGITGIVGECGGGLACATCHVFVVSGADEISEISRSERDMLDFTAVPKTPDSRLSCQIVMSPQTTGVIVKIADHQY